MTGKSGFKNAFSAASFPSALAEPLHGSAGEAE